MVRWGHPFASNFENAHHRRFQGQACFTRFGLPGPNSPTKRHKVTKTSTAAVRKQSEMCAWLDLWDPVLHFFFLFWDLWLQEVQWYDEIQNSQLLISAEMIRRGWGEAEIIF